MTRRRLTDILTIGLAVLYILAGVAETIRAVVTGDGGIPFWFGSLVGGGTLILVGAAMSARRPRAYAVLVTVGCLAGVLATMWTLVVPLIAVTVIVLALQRSSEAMEAQRVGETGA